MGIEDGSMYGWHLLLYVSEWSFIMQGGEGTPYVGHKAGYGTVRTGTDPAPVTRRRSAAISQRRRLLMTGPGRQVRRTG